MMTGINPFAPDLDAMLVAGRRLAMRSDVDCEVLEGLIRKVSKAAQHDLFMRMLPRAVNDQEVTAG